MDIKKLSDLTDQELLAEAKKMKNNAIITAFFIGFLVGISIYSIARNSLGFFALLPLYLAYRLSKSKTDYDQKELDNCLKERGLK